MKDYLLLFVLGSKKKIRIEKRIQARNFDDAVVKAEAILKERGWKAEVTIAQYAMGKNNFSVEEQKCPSKNLKQKKKVIKKKRKKVVISKRSGVR